MSQQHAQPLPPHLPQAEMVVVLKDYIEKHGRFDDAFAALKGFETRTLPDGIQVGTHRGYAVGAVIGPTIAALTCAHTTSAELTRKAVSAGLGCDLARTLTWDQTPDQEGHRATAVQPLSRDLNLQITCMDEEVDPNFNGQTVSGATIILQLVTVSERRMH